MPEPRFAPTGDMQEVTGHRQEHAERTFDQDAAYARASGTHLWIIVVCHRATDQMLNAYDGKGDELTLLDADTLLMRPMPGCYICEEPYTTRNRRRRCPGAPR